MLPGSPHLETLSNGQTTWPEFRKTLSPRYAIVWRDIVLCYILAFSGPVFHALIASRVGVGTEILSAIVGSVWCGYWLHALMLFGHEAAHNNIAPRKNDMVANWTIWLPFGLSTAQYRRTHWEHHLHLGDHDDPEHSYHNCMHPLFLLKLFTGVYLVSMLSEYQGKATSKEGKNRQSAFTAVVRTLLFHAIVVTVCLRYGSLSVAAVWVLGNIAVFPFFATVRQILEHRIVEATCDRDFTDELHGPLSRMFGSDLFSRYFGAAGFNKHLLHHWDPHVSYTCFKDMEEFLRKTSVADALQHAQSTYGSTLLAMLRSAHYEKH